MTAVAVTSTAHNPLAPSWDEAIVPTLRKRLESESRMLTQRLSTISGGSADDAKQQPQPQEEPHDTRPPTSSSRRTPNGTRSHTPTNPNHLPRPSAIPRPSFSRPGERPITPANRNHAAAPAEPSSSHENQSTTATSARKRTQSTPFPFDPPPDPPNSSLPNGKQSTSSNNSNSGAAKSNGGRTTPTPSRIPTVPSRIRSGSQSSQGLNTIGKSVGAKIAPSEPNSTHISESPSTLNPVPPSSASTSASRHRASEDHQGYRANKQSHAGREESVNERLSSDEEKPFVHWYRGDVSRNGGVGEYRVGKREEMLDIASFGHKPLNKARRPQESHGLPPMFNDRSLRKRAESISSIERTSLHLENPDGSITGRLLDEAPLEDPEFNSVNRRPRRQSIASMERMSLYMEPVEGLDGVPSSEAKSNTMNSDSPSPTTLPEPKNNYLPSSATQGKHPQSRTRKVSNPRHESKASTSTTASLPETLASRKARGRTQSPVERSKTPQKRVDQKRSKSAADAVLHLKPPDGPDDSELTPDAIPDTRTPIPIDGNWDEMVLPTVARRMGIEYEKKDPATAKSSESPVAPAPGTFGFDYTKYRPWRPSEEEAIAMSEFGMRSSPPPPPPQNLGEEELRPQEQPTQQEPSLSQPSYEVPIEKPPEAIQQMRPRRDTLPPFAHYAGTHPPKERQDMPQVVIHSQDMETQRATVYVEEGEETRCCKCIIM